MELAMRVLEVSLDDRWCVVDIDVLAGRALVLFLDIRHDNSQQLDNQHCPSGTAPAVLVFSVSPSPA